MPNLFAILIINLIMTMVLEGSTLYLLGYSTYKESCKDALIVNLISSVIGFLLYGVLFFDATWDDFAGGPGLGPIFLVYYILVTVIEGVLLKLFNRTYPVLRVVIFTLVMNIISLIVFYLLFALFFIL